jgi:hypothetical protein
VTVNPQLAQKIAVVQIAHIGIGKGFRPENIDIEDGFRRPDAMLFRLVVCGLSGNGRN